MADVEVVETLLRVRPVVGVPSVVLEVVPILHPEFFELVGQLVKEEDEAMVEVDALAESTVLLIPVLIRLALEVGEVEGVVCV